jgi:hypothetical protein
MLLVGRKRGVIYRPEGKGPLPGVVYNHGTAAGERLPRIYGELAGFARITRQSEIIPASLASSKHIQAGCPPWTKRRILSISS